MYKIPYPTKLIDLCRLVRFFKFLIGIRFRTIFLRIKIKLNYNYGVINVLANDLLIETLENINTLYVDLFDNLLYSY